MYFESPWELWYSNFNSKWESCQPPLPPGGRRIVGCNTGGGFRWTHTVLWYDIHVGEASEVQASSKYPSGWSVYMAVFGQPPDCKIREIVCESYFDLGLGYGLIPKETPILMEGRRMLSEGKIRELELLFPNIVAW